MTTKTSPIPPGHPLAILLERSQRANKLPSCGECKHSLKFLTSLQCRTEVKNHGLEMFEQVAELREVPQLHFCAAWEPK